MRLALVLLLLSVDFCRGSGRTTTADSESDYEDDESVCSEIPTLAETCGEDSFEYMEEVEEAIMGQDDLKDPTRCLATNGSLKVMNIFNYHCFFVDIFNICTVIAITMRL